MALLSMKITKTPIGVSAQCRRRCTLFAQMMVDFKARTRLITIQAAKKPTCFNRGLNGVKRTFVLVYNAVRGPISV
jgi:hypothetical protein